jgi:deazaflavin-dependent oxidoreductase (nitroreductase family)
MTTRDSSKWNMMNLYPRGHWARLTFKAPLVAWRLGMGPITGRLFMVLTTKGRKSGLARHTMVEYYKLNGTKYATCAFGARAQYYQNILSDPHVTVQTADGTESALAVRVTDAHELLAVYELFKRRDPPLLHWYLSSLGIKPEPDAVLANRERVHFLRFDPVSEFSPPGLEVDLAWLWPVALLGLLVWRRVRSIART